MSDAAQLKVPAAFCRTTRQQSKSEMAEKKEMEVEIEILEMQIEIEK